MRLAGASVKRKKKFKVTTDSRHKLPVAPNLLNRDFEVAEPNRTWVSDITYVWTREGWLYLATVLDLFSRQVVGWAVNRSMTQELVMDRLQDGDLAPPAFSGTHPAYRPGQPVLQPSLSATAEKLRRHQQHESQG